MDVGIVTRYYNHEATYVALILAEWFASRGDDVTFFTHGGRQVQVGTKWDDYVYDFGPRSFTAWASRRDVIIWTHVPPKVQLGWCNRRDIRTVVVPLWTELNTSHRKTLNKAHSVLATCHGVLYTLERMRCLGNAKLAPMIPGLPLTNKQQLREPGKIKAVFPMYQDLHVLKDPLQVVRLVLAKTDNVEFTIPYLPGQWEPRSRRALQSIVSHNAGRVRVLPGLAVCHRPVAYYQHDVLVWHQVAENAGLCGLMALAVGTPVVTFDGPMLSDVLSRDNSIRVQTPIDCNPLTIPGLTPDYDELAAAVIKLAQDPQQILTLQLHTSQNLEVRERMFTEVLGDVRKVAYVTE